MTPPSNPLGKKQGNKPTEGSVDLSRRMLLVCLPPGKTFPGNRLSPLHHRPRRGLLRNLLNLLTIENFFQQDCCPGGGPRDILD